MSISTTDKVTGIFTIPETNIELDYTVRFQSEGMDDVDFEPCWHCDDEYTAWNDAHGAEIDVEELIQAEAQAELTRSIAKERKDSTLTTITITVDNNVPEGIAKPARCILAALHEAEMQGLIEAAMNIKVEEDA